MIDHRNSLIVIRNPKAASTSLRAALSGADCLDIKNQSHMERFYHLTPDYYPPEKMATYISVVTIREPVERAVSFWKYFKSKGGYSRFESVMDWALEGCPAPVGFFKNEFDAGCNVMDQSGYVAGVDIVIRTDGMLQKVNRVRRLINLPKLDSIPRLNVSANQAGALPTPELRRMLEDRFHDDLVLFEKWK